MIVLWICALLWIVAFLDLWIIRQALHGKHVMAKFFRYSLAIEASGAAVSALFIYRYNISEWPLLIFLVGHVCVQLSTIIFHRHRFKRL